MITRTYLEVPGQKFWRIGVSDAAGNQVATAYGKVGGNGQTTLKDFADADAADKFIAKQVAAKKKKGYVDAVDPNGPTSGSKRKAAAAPKPAAKKKATAAAAAAKKKKAVAAPKKKAAAKKPKVNVNKNPGKKTAKAGLSGLGGPDDDAVVEAVDSGVAAINPEVAEDGTVYEDYSTKLVLVNVAQNTDKYYILQLIEAEDAENYYVYRRSGRTGSAGQGQLDGPLDLDAAEAKFEKLFTSKCGQDWADRDPTHVPANPTVYTYLKQDWGAREEEDEGQWMYHLTRDPHGKPDGWYPYDKAASDSVEDLHQTYTVDGNATMSTRFVFAPSSGFTYRVDLTKNTQTNTTSGTERSIRRDTAPDTV